LAPGVRTGPPHKEKGAVLMTSKKLMMWIGFVAACLTPLLFMIALSTPSEERLLLYLRSFAAFSFAFSAILAFCRAAAAAD
jgi:hypothetical protein